MKMELLPYLTLLTAYLGLRIAYIMWKPIAHEGWLTRNLNRGSYVALGATAIALLIFRGWGWQVAWIFSVIVAVGLFVFAAVSCNAWKKMYPETLPQEEL